MLQGINISLSLKGLVQYATINTIDNKFRLQFIPNI